MALWVPWCTALSMLRPAFSRQVSFLWFAVCIAGLSVRTDNLGVTSIVRALGLDPARYPSLLRCCHSRAIQLPALQRCWTAAVLALFAERVVRVNGRPVLVADGKNVARARGCPRSRACTRAASRTPGPPSSWATAPRRSRCSHARQA